MVELKPKDLIGTSIWHLHTNGESNEIIWWNEEIVDGDSDPSDANGPVSFVIYDERGDFNCNFRRSFESLGWSYSLNLDGEHGPDQ